MRGTTIPRSGVDDDDNAADDWDEIDKLLEELDVVNEGKVSEGVDQPSSGDASSSPNIWEAMGGYGSDGEGQREQRTRAAGADAAAASKENLSLLKIAELKERLRSYGLPVSGKKAVLVERLQGFLSTYEQSKSARGRGDFLPYGDAPGMDSSFDSDGDIPLIWDEFDATNGGMQMATQDYKPLYVPEPEQVDVDPELRDQSYHLRKRFPPKEEEEGWDGEGFGGEEFGDDVFQDVEVPADPEALLSAYEHLPEGYSWKGSPDKHPKFQGYTVFSLADGVDFLVKGDINGELDLRDVLVYDAGTALYAAPKVTGAVSQTPAHYYVYPSVQWYPGDILELKNAGQQVVKLILVEVKNADPTDFELNIRNTVVLDGTKRTVKGVESSSDYERIRDGKAGVLTGCDFGGQAFAQPLRIAFNGGHAHEDGAQTFGVCVRDDSVDVQRWTHMRDMTAVVKETERAEATAGEDRWTPAKTGVEKDSPFKFLGKVTGDEVLREWEELGLDESVPPEFDFDLET